VALDEAADREDALLVVALLVEELRDEVAAVGQGGSDSQEVVVAD
jgi:hypothetical protein